MAIEEFVISLLSEILGEIVFYQMKWSSVYRLMQTNEQVSMCSKFQKEETLFEKLIKTVSLREIT